MERAERLRKLDKLALDVSEAAELLGVSRPTMYQIMNRSDFTAAFYIGRLRKISREGLEDWIKQQTEASA